MRGQRLSIAIGVAAALLIAGRTAAVMYAEYEWLLVAGARSIWSAHVENAVLLYGTALVIGIAFAWINVSAVRRSVISLIVPKRLANVEFGEEVPSIRLRSVTALMSLGVALASLIALPGWSTLALWRSNVVFAEADPYLNIELEYYVSWLPVEFGIYAWAVTLFAITAVIVVTLYALTPSLSWSSHGLRISAYARRHIAVLSTILMLFAAWSFRLAAYKLLIAGSGAGGTLTSLDHRWLIPGDWIFAVLAIAAAFVLLVAGWMGQTSTALATVTIIILGAAGTQLVGPWMAQRVADAPGGAAAEQPYRDTRDAYTARAFPIEPVPPSLRFVADSALVARAGQLQIRNALPDIVYPNAIGDLVVRDPTHVIAAPRLSNGWSRLMHAWAEQNPRLLNGTLDSDDAYVRTRDVRDRVAKIAPIFAQSGAIGAVPTAKSWLWIVDLYSVSETYPLAVPHPRGSQRLTYRHHAATAYVSGGTGAVVVVPDSALDPIARAWFGKHPGDYLSPIGVPTSMVQPPPLPPQSPLAGTAGVPTADPFRQEVTRIYDKMRAALDSSDFKKFGVAFDSLGIVIRGTH